MTVPPEMVFRVLSDGWLYGLWVVGASHIRDVDRTWPHEDSKIYHAFGAWPLLVRDTSAVLENNRPRRLVLQARAWPAGQARIEIDIEPTDAGCRVVMTEYPVSGIGALLHNPALDKLLTLRNNESLRRLAALAENREPAQLTP